MRILGIDPGIATCGWGVIDMVNNKPKVISYGTVLTSKDDTMPDRLKILSDDIKKIIDKFKPDEIALEELFYNDNAKTAINVAQARGVILLTCIQNCTSLYEYTPLQVKQALTGYGRAEKRQMQEMTKTFLGLKEIPKPDDAADALAIALTHSQTSRLKTGFKIR